VFTGKGLTAATCVSGVRRLDWVLQPEAPTSGAEDEDTEPGI